MSARVWIGVMQDGHFHADDGREYTAHCADLDGYEVEQVIRKRRSSRTLRQNRWFHAFMRPLAEHLGYEVEDLKLAGLIALFGTDVVMGYTVPTKPHTSDLNTEEFSDLCEWFVQKAAECGFVVLYPEEFKRQHRRGAKGSLGESAHHTSRRSLVPGELVDSEDACASPAASRRA